jgi:PAS domain S-box-containing protein
VTLSFTKRFLPEHNEREPGSTLIDTITALAQSSTELNALLRCAADEIGSALGLQRAAILLLNDNNMRLAADYCESRVGPVQREKLRQLDIDITLELGPLVDKIEIADAQSDARVRRRLAPAAGRPQEPAIRSILIVPLVIDSETVGTMLLYKGGKRGFSSPVRYVAGAAASVLSLAIHHFRSQDRARGAADREALTNQLLTAIRNTVGVEEVLKVAVEGIGRTLKVSRVIIYKHGGGDFNRDSLFTAQAEYRSNALVPSLLKAELDLEGSPLLGQLLSGQVIEVPDTSQSDPIVRAMSVRLGVRAMALAPITYNGHTAATITLEQFDNPRVFSKDEIKLFRLVTEQTAVALYQAELYREAQEAARRDALISKIGSAIHSSLDAEAVLRAIVDGLGVALSVCRCRMALFPSPLPEMVPVNHEYVAACCSDKSSVLQEIQTVNNPFLQSVLSQESPVAVGDPANDPRFAPLSTRLEAGSVKSILTTAIRVDGKPIGILSLHHCDRPHKWTRWEADLVKSVADQAAVAIRQAELYRDVRESAQRASLANQIVASIRRSLDLNETLQVAVEEVGQALGANRTFFCKLVGNETVMVAEYLSDPGLTLSHVRSTADDYITYCLLETRRTLIIDDLRAFSNAYPDLAATVAVWQVEPLNLSQIVCPIFVNGACWGALSINQTDQVRKWTPSEIALVEMVAAQVEVAVSHSKLFQETKQAAEREALISHIIHGINQSNRSDEILPIVTRELAEHLAADRIVVTRFNEASGLWATECEYSDGSAIKPNRTYRPEEVDRFAGLAENDVIRCNDSADDPRLDDQLRATLRAAGTRSFISARLEYKDGTQLVLSAIMKSNPRIWTADEIEVIRAAADQVGIALERAELFDMVSHGKFQWEATFDALSDGIFIFDQKGVLKRINEAAAAFEGADMRELIGRRCCTLLQGVEGETCRVAQVIESGRPATFELVPGRLSRPVLVTISPVTSGSRSRYGAREDGNNGHHNAPRGAVCIVRDLSELRAAEAIAREQRSFLVKLIEHANDSILAFSPDGKLIWFNEQLIAHSGYTRQELEGGDYRLFVAGDQKKLATERFSRALEGQAQTFEMNVPRKNGDTRVMLITYTPIYDEGRVTSVLSIARDVTEERLARERAAQADKLRALGQLAAGVAHNFNNILAAILGHAQLIKRDCTDEALAQRMEIIEQAALDGAQTVKRIQAFGSQQNESVNEVVDVNQLIKDSTTLTRTRWCDEAQARGVQYEVELDLLQIPFVRGSASELGEVFVNLILNALDAMPQGGQLRIATEAKGGSVQATVTDSGVGMNSETCEHIFEPFFTTKGVMGTGLGLAVSHSIIERHGGSIDAQSSPGKGTTFRIGLPTGEIDNRNVTRSPGAEARSVNVLVVDDDQRVRDAVVGMLTMAGHHTDHAGSGQEALAKLERDRFDVVFTDLSMPEMDGWAVASEVHRRWPSVKVVLITGNALEPEIVDGNRGLVSEVIFKPVRFDDLSSAMDQALSN